MSVQPPSAERQQFSLRALFISLTALGLLLGSYIWLGPCGFFFSSLLAIYVAVRVEWLRVLEGLVAVAIAGVIVAFLMPSNYFEPKPDTISKCRNNLRQITLALHLYHDEHGCFPPLATYSEAGRPMHSWRIYITPHIERMDLAQNYDWTEPWNGPMNSRLHSSVRVDVFRCPKDRASPRENTSYLAVEVPGAKPGDPFAVIEVHGSGVHFLEPKDVALADILAKQPPVGVILPNGVHGHKSRMVQIGWPTGEVETVDIDDLPKLLAKMQPPSIREAEK